MSGQTLIIVVIVGGLGPPQTPGASLRIAESQKHGRIGASRVIGISEDNEFTPSMLAEIEAAHEANRGAALAMETPRLLWPPTAPVS